MIKHDKTWSLPSDSFFSFFSLSIFVFRAKATNWRETLSPQGASALLLGSPIQVGAAPDPKDVSTNRCEKGTAHHELHFTRAETVTMSQCRPVSQFSSSDVHG